MSRPKAGNARPLLLGGMVDGSGPATGPAVPCGSPAPAVRVACPFSVVVDTRESKPYTFEGLRADSDRRNAFLDVRTVRYCLPQGDYQVFGLPAFVIERKSKADLFGSVARRDNFINRLELMQESRPVSAVVVEAEISEILANPPYHSNLNVKALIRTIQAWSLRYPAVHWHFLPGREAAEAWTFRLLERYWKDHRAEVVEAVHREPGGDRTRSIDPSAGPDVTPCPLCGAACSPPSPIHPPAAQERPAQ